MRGMVTEAKGKRLRIRPGDSASCENCFGCCNGAEVAEFEAENRSGIELKDGDIVEYKLAQAGAAAGILYLAFPLVLLGAGYGLVSALAPHAGEGVAAAAGLGGLALGFLAAWRAGRRSKSEGGHAVVTAKVDTGAEMRGFEPGEALEHDPHSNF